MFWFMSLSIALGFLFGTIFATQSITGIDVICIILDAIVLFISYKQLKGNQKHKKCM